jgi:hypothetical protein
VDFVGTLGLARTVLMLLAVAGQAADDSRRARRERQERSGGS